MKTKMYLSSLGITIIIIAVLTILAWSWLPRKVREPIHRNIVDATAGVQDMTTLNRMLKDTGLDELLKKNGPYTLFAPNDQAFQRMPDDIGPTWRREWRSLLLVRILMHHVVNGRYPLNQLAKMTTLTTRAGQTLNISTTKRAILVDQAKVLRADIECSNGIIHVIDTVMLPWKDKTSAWRR